MAENQNVEYKESWKDENLKTICAFANSQGGSLYIGICDEGSVFGVNNSEKLLEDIPNKVINYLGIIVDVQVHDKSGLEYIVVIVPQSSVPIAFRGIYYVRSGSTKQELKGAALQQFILRKMGKTFDELPADSADITHIDGKVVEKFLKKALAINRISTGAEFDDISSILLNLKLISEDNKIKNAAVLLFGYDPLKFFITSIFKIGRFGKSDHDLRFQDIIDGNIFEMPDKVMELLRAKYLISPIRYEGLQRIEELEYPEEALREAILNAVVHKDYTGAPIQLSIYDDRLILWNEGKLPSDITVQMLKEKHPSRPHNKYIADIFFKAGYIETWGRGIAKIMDGCKKAGLPEPEINEVAGGVQLTFFKSTESDLQESKEKSKEKGKEKSKEKIIKAIAANSGISILELSAITGLSRSGVEKNIRSLKKHGTLTRKGPAKGGHWQINE